MTTLVIYVRYTHDRDVPVHGQQSERVLRVLTRVIWRCLVVGAPRTNRCSFTHAFVRGPLFLSRFLAFSQPSFRWWALPRALSRVGLVPFTPSRRLDGELVLARSAVLVFCSFTLPAVV